MARARTLLDFASFADLSYVLDQRRAPRRYSWSYQCAYETTCLLVSMDTINLAPAMPRSAPSGPSAVLLSALGTSIKQYRVAKQLQNAAHVATQSWADQAENQKLIGKFVRPPVDRAESDARYLESAFLESEKRYWPHTVMETQGLFDAAFLPQIARIVDVPLSDLEALYTVTKERPQLLKKPEVSFNGEQISILERSFLASVLLRGVYREGYARNVQVLHHPYRGSFFDQLGVGASERLFSSTNSVRALASILIEASMRQKGGESRIRHYATSIQILRAAAKHGRVNLKDVDQDDTALKDAADAMIRLGIRTRSAYSEKWIEAFIGGGITWATSFGLTPWESLGIGLATSTFSSLVGAGTLAGGLALERRYRLVDLGRSSWGRLQRRF